MNDDTYNLNITDEDGCEYSLKATFQELLYILNMPYRCINSNDLDTPSHIRTATFDAYRLGEYFHIAYDHACDNKQRGAISPTRKYSDIQTILSSTIDMICTNEPIENIEI